MTGWTSSLRGVAVLVAFAFVLSGCAGSTDPAGETATSEPTTSTSTTPPQAEITVDPASESTDVMPDAEVTVQVLRGDLTEVSVVGSAGDEVTGKADGQTWTSTSRLRPSSDYTVTTTAEGPEGGTTVEESTFSTHDPQITATYGIVYSGQTVGVGMPVSIQFDSAVTDAAYRRAIEQAVSVETQPATEGSWGWLDNRQLMWRPKEFWQPGTTVSVNAPIAGYQTGEDKWVGEDLTGSTTIGRRQVSTVDIASHRMRVTRGGQTVKSFPVSSGKPGKDTETRSGMKVVIGKQKEMTMDAATLGIDEDDPDYYKVETNYNVRVTWTGEFVHSAPWSVSAQGNTNVSHGCVNMAPKNAKWFYDNSLPGDPVDFSGSNREFKPTEGIGVWQYSWEQWQQQSALA